jgi:hypothetical protein
MREITMDLIDALYEHLRQDKFFITKGFTKHAGTEKLQSQLETQVSNEK